MLFNSLPYILFLPLVVALYYLLPNRLRWILLLVSSYAFYMFWKPEFLLLILTITFIDYFSALEMQKQSAQKSKKIYLLVSLGANLGLLLLFRYFNFFSDSLSVMTANLGINIEWPVLDLIVPVGIAFFTLQSIGYMFDVYTGKIKAEKHLGYYALYLAFFPKLIAGPIEPYRKLVPQFKKGNVLKYENLSNGFRLILFGLVLKMLVSDNLKPFVDQVYDHPMQAGSLDIILASLFFSFQIYADFFGYTLIALGSARLMGINLSDNFRTPYLAAGMADFWNRWHITFSNWFRNYLYYPMGGARIRKWRRAVTILFLFALAGLWYGANWNFVIWGVVMGLFFLIERVLPLPEKWKSPAAFSLQHIVRFSFTFVLITLGWVLFRSADLQQSILMFDQIISGTLVTGLLQVPVWTWILLLAFVISEFVLYNTRFDLALAKLPLVVRWLVYAILISGLLLFGAIENYPFIFYQF